MPSKRLYVTSLLVVTLAVGMPFYVAPAAAENGLYLSPGTTGSNTSRIALNDDVALRGRISAIPQGTIMMIKLDHPVSTYSGKIGDPVGATVDADIFLDNRIVIPEGSMIEGSVTGVSPAAHLGKNGALEIQFHVIKTPYGATMPIRAHLVTEDNSGVIKGGSDQAQVLKTFGTAAGGAAAGTLMGTAAGSILGSAGTGATFGLAAGSLAGIGYAVVRTGKHVEIPRGARMSIVLDEPVGIN